MSYDIDAVRAQFPALATEDDGLRRIAEIAWQVNEKTENIGARRLHTVLERLLDTVSYEAPDRSGDRFTIDRAYVDQHLDQIKAAGGNAVLYCNDLHFTKFAEQLLMRKGVKGFHHLEGGLNGWREAGLGLQSSLPE